MAPGSAEPSRPFPTLTVSATAAVPHPSPRPASLARPLEQQQLQQKSHVLTVQRQQPRMPPSQPQHSQQLQQQQQRPQQQSFQQHDAHHTHQQSQLPSPQGPTRLQQPQPLQQVPIGPDCNIAEAGAAFTARASNAACAAAPTKQPSYVQRGDVLALMPGHPAVTGICMTHPLACSAVSARIFRGSGSRCSHKGMASCVKRKASLYAVCVCTRERVVTHMCRCAGSWMLLWPLSAWVWREVQSVCVLFSLFCRACSAFSV